MPHFPVIWDSTEPANVPSGSFAIVYPFGKFAWSQRDVERMSAVYRLIDQPDRPDFMHDARGVAVEPGAVSVQMAIASCRQRWELHHDDFTVYTSLEAGPDPDFQPGMAGIIEALRAHAPGRPFRIHVADWDGNPNNRPEVDGIAAWAKQYLPNIHGGIADLSALYGVNDLVRP